MDTAKVYTRHARSCPKKTDRYWGRCNCHKWIWITNANGSRRVSAGTRTWAEAQKKANQLANPQAPLRPARKSIESAIDDYLGARQAANVKHGTMKKIHTFRSQLLHWSRNAGLMYLDEFTLHHLEKFRASWKDQALSRKLKQGRLRSWLAYCLRHRWVENNLANDLETIIVDPKPTLPFTPEEYHRILDAVSDMYQSASGYSNQQVQFFKNRMRALIMLLRWSGLRITDALTLRRDRLSPDGRLFLYLAKTGSPVSIRLRPDVRGMLETLPSPNPDYFFWSGRGRPTQVADNYRPQFRKLFRLAGVDGPHPHRFRDTFAIECLLANVPLEQVSMLLGHKSVKITEKHYAPWIHARQKQLDDSVERTWVQERPPQASRLTQ